MRSARRAKVGCGVFLVVGAFSAFGQPAFVWWEGEKTNADNFAQRTGFDARTFRDTRSEVLSEGDWLTNEGVRKPGEPEAFARYRIRVPTQAKYSLWCRKFWKHGPFRWRFDDQAWQICGRDVSLADNTYIRLHLGANWVYLGDVDLGAGEHDFELRLLAGEGEAKTACFDAFVLTRGPFVPRGKLKPNEVSGKADPGYFAWEPPPDPLVEGCPIDLRRLNEGTAGENGFVRRRGAALVLGDGRPVRFWMVQGSALLPMAHGMMDWWARRLAKYGVNLVRVEARIQDAGGATAGAIDRNKLDRLHYLVAALKKQGIYTYLGHVFWANRAIDSAKGFPPGYTNRPCHGLLEFSAEMKEIYRGWAKALMTTPNPYTGMSLARDPAVAVYEIQNEDSVLFWTFNPTRFPEPTRALIERQFGRWLRRKYGSAKRALEAWGPGKYPEDIASYKKLGRDDWESGRVKLYGAGHLTGQRWAVNQRNPKRAADQLRFMVETQKGSYEDLVRYLRNDLGMKCAIACSNWKTADARVLDTLERYTYTAGDVMCRNEYFGVTYKPKPKRFYAVDVGDTYRATSGLLSPARVPLQLHQLADYPHMITENNWDRPNRFRVEWPFLIATYGTLSGADGWNFFSLGSSIWDSSMNIWGVNDTTVLGQFPAAALIFRQGYVREAEVVVHEALSLEEQYAFKGTAIREAQDMDELWRKTVGADQVPRGQNPSTIDPLVFYVGRVTRSLDGDPSRALVRDLRPYLDRGGKVIRSTTGELVWDYGQGVVTVDTPRAQGACGFLGRVGRIELGDVVIESAAEYISVLVVSLDGKPLAAAARILIQAGTEDHPFGFSTEPVQDPELGVLARITALGGYPLNVREIQAAVTLKGAASRKAVVLDGNGYPTDRRPRTRADEGGFRIRLPGDALYTLVQ